MKATVSSSADILAVPSCRFVTLSNVSTDKLSEGHSSDVAAKASRQHCQKPRPVYVRWSLKHRSIILERAIGMRSGALALLLGAAMGCGASRPWFASGNAPLVAAIQPNGAAHPGAAASTAERHHHFDIPSVSLHVVQPPRPAVADSSSENMPSDQLLVSWRCRQLTGRTKHGSRPAGNSARDLRHYAVVQAFYDPQLPGTTPCLVSVSYLGPPS